jgi:hypothetical protein
VVIPPGSFDGLAAEPVAPLAPAPATTGAGLLGGAGQGHLRRRLFPLVATLVLIVVAMTSAIWLGPGMAGKTAWALPDDLWGTLTAAQRLAHLDLAGLYTQPTGLVSLPGTALILVPVVAITEAAGISLQAPSTLYTHPTAWLIAGPYEIALSAIVLFAADAIAEHLGVAWPWRVCLATAETVALWSVSARWGHPEDAVAVGLLLYAVLALSRANTGRSGWLMGVAIAVQPLVLLALPVIATAAPLRRLPGFVARAATPAALLLGVTAWANWSATVTAVTQQPNSATVNHLTLWTPLSPHLGGGMVAGGPGRVLAIIAACSCAVIAGHRLRAARDAGRLGCAWEPQVLEDLLWWAAVALALRTAFESVMVAYYLWPVLAVALVAAARSWPRLAATSAATVVLTFASQAPWRSPWAWWVPMLAGLGLTLLLARVPVQQLWQRLATSRAAASS